jgi:uncharacterized protein
MSHKHKHQKASTPRIPWQQFVARFEAEKIRQLQRYCERFELWRHCPVARCRRHRTCSNELPFCTAWAILKLPAQALRQAAQDILDATPPNIGAPERAARRLAPYDLSSADTTADAVAQYLWHQSFPRIFTRARREELRSVGFSVAAEMHTRPIRMLRFDFGSVTLDAELLKTPTAEAIRLLLPRTGSAVTWEGGLYFQTDLKIPLWNEPSAVTPGDIAYCADPQAIAIPFGRRPMPRDEERRRERPCSVWARAVGDVSTLAAVKEGTEVKVSAWLAPPPRGALTSLRRMLRREHGITPSARNKLHD